MDLLCIIECDHRLGKTVLTCLCEAVSVKTPIHKWRETLNTSDIVTPSLTHFIICFVTSFISCLIKLQHLFYTRTALCSLLLHFTHATLWEVKVYIHAMHLDKWTARMTNTWLMDVFPLVQHLSLKQTNDPVQRGKSQPRLIIIWTIFKLQNTSPFSN